jgi:hypothetical protein
MTEQPVETEQQFLGNASYVAPRIVQPPAQAVIPLQHYAPNAHRLRVSPLAALARQDIQEAIAERAAAHTSVPTAADTNLQRKVEGARTPLDHTAEIHAGNAVHSLQNGELDEGIAWLQSALAFALNHRHSLTEETAR